MVLNLPLDECHDNTHSHQFRKARNMRNEQIQTSDQKPNQKQGQDHLNKKVSVPSGKGNDSTKLRQNAHNADSSWGGKRA
jgi:hypothetical protein